MSFMQPYDVIIIGAGHNGLTCAAYLGMAGLTVKVLERRAVVGGAAGPRLLDTYHDERHPVGRFAARQSLTGPTVAVLPLGDDRPQLPVDEECSMFSLLIGYRYRSAAVVTGGS